MVQQQVEERFYALAQKRGVSRGQIEIVWGEPGFDVALGRGILPSCTSLAVRLTIRASN